MWVSLLIVAREELGVAILKSIKHQTLHGPILRKPQGKIMHEQET